MPKRRFGISINEDIAEKLNLMAEKLGLDRSSIIEMVLRSVLGDLSHYMIEHDCTALIAHVCEKSVANVESTIWGYKELRVTQIHDHIGGKCVQLLFIRGLSNMIVDLYSNLAKIKECKTVYVPLDSLGDGENRGEEVR